MSAPGDAANAAVRAALDAVSKDHGKWDRDAKAATLEHFENRCAYSGQEFPQDANGNPQIVWDHATPANRKHCGLTLMGNMLPVTATENRNKGGDRDFREYLRDRHEVLQCVQRFRKESNYPEAEIEGLKVKLGLLYAVVDATVRATIDQCVREGAARARRGTNVQKLLEELRTFLRQHERRPRTNAANDNERRLANRCASKVSNLRKLDENQRNDTMKALIAIWENR